MPVGMKFHHTTVPQVDRRDGLSVGSILHTKSKAASMFTERTEAQMANDLLELRSKNINYIMEQRKVLGPGGAIQIPPENARIQQLHTQLQIDKVVLVSSPLNIDTTPQKAGDPQGRWKTNYNGPMLDTAQYSMNGMTAPGVAFGQRIRGGWPVQ